MSHIYQIRIQQTLDATWDEWFAPLEIHPQPNGTTLLTGDLPDQTALHSVLNKIRNLNLELVSVNYTEAQEDSKNIDETDKKNNVWKPWLMLVIRSLLFRAFQALIALGFFIGGTFTAWDTSAAWWPFAIILTDLACLALLIRFYRQEGKRFWDVFRIERQFFKGHWLLISSFIKLIKWLGIMHGRLKIVFFRSVCCKARSLNEKG